MKAAIYLKYGDPSRVLKVKEIEKPEPKTGEILVRVFAATVNRTDEGIVTARYVVSRLYSGLFTPTRQVPGTDFAGVVEGVANAVTDFKVGDRVFGFDDEGISSHAEYLVVSQNKAVAKMPKACSYAEAAASLEGVHYAYNFINKVKLKPGQNVLVNGATGAIGSAAVQLLRYFETNVTATANTKNLDLVRSLGAKRVIDYTKENFWKENGISDVESEKYDFIFDAVGNSSFRICKPLLKENGIYLSSEPGAYGSNILLALTTRITVGKKVLFPVPSSIQKTIHFIKPLLEQGTFRPVIDRTYPLEQIVDAFSYVQTGQKTGNVVVKMTVKE